MKRYLRSNVSDLGTHEPGAPSRAARGSLWFRLAACGALVAGCQGGTPRDLGASSAPFTLDAPFESDSNEFVGRWTGSAEDVLSLTGQQETYHFPSGSPQILLDVESGPDVAGTGPLQGFIRFGSGDPLPPPTDPDSGYPAGVSYDALLSYGGDGLGIFIADHALPPFEGVDYPVGSRGELTENEDGSTVAGDGVLSFTFSVNQPLDAWCRLQTPHLYEDTSDFYRCLPNTGGQVELWSPGTDAMCELSGPNDASNCTDPSELPNCVEFGEPVAYINCDKAFLCYSDDYCTCTADGCTATDTRSRLTLRRVGDELVGVFQNTVFVNERNLRVPLGEVRLQRSED